MWLCKLRRGGGVLSGAGRAHKPSGGRAIWLWRAVTTQWNAQIPPTVYVDPWRQAVFAKRAMGFITGKLLPSVLCRCQGRRWSDLSSCRPGHMVWGTGYCPCNSPPPPHRCWHGPGEKQGCCNINRDNLVNKLNIRTISFVWFYYVFTFPYFCFEFQLLLFSFQLFVFSFQLISFQTFLFIITGNKKPHLQLLNVCSTVV